VLFRLGSESDSSANSWPSDSPYCLTLHFDLLFFNLNTGD